MTQENEPIAPKESAWKYSHWGIISLVIFILWLFMIFIGMSGPYPHVPQVILNVGGFATFGSPIVETIFAVIGLFRDRKKEAATIALVLGIIPTCWALLLIMLWLNHGSGI